MDGVSAIGNSSGIESLRLAAEYQARVLKTQQVTMNLQGELALRLIESAVVPVSEQRLDLRV